ncbi:unnamed protein product, partial [Amoebophrya sp. A25]|eukprot:GSA25T00016696001.1
MIKGGSSADAVTKGSSTASSKSAAQNKAPNKASNSNATAASLGEDVQSKQPRAAVSGDSSTNASRPGCTGNGKVQGNGKV